LQRLNASPSRFTTLIHDSSGDHTGPVEAYGHIPQRLTWRESDRSSWLARMTLSQLCLDVIVVLRE
jgi:hypothetical protein